MLIDKLKQISTFSSIYLSGISDNKLFLSSYLKNPTGSLVTTVRLIHVQTVVTHCQFWFHTMVCLISQQIPFAIIPENPHTH